MHSYAASVLPVYFSLSHGEDLGYDVDWNTYLSLSLPWFDPVRAAA